MHGDFGRRRPEADDSGQTERLRSERARDVSNAPSGPTAVVELSPTARQARAGEYLGRDHRFAGVATGGPPGIRAFRQVSALGEPEFMRQGGLIDLQA